MSVAIIIFDGFHSLDLAGPLEVLSKANRHAPGSPPFQAHYRVIVASVNGGMVASDAGLAIATSCALASLPESLDIIIVSGGSEEGLRRAAMETNLLGWLKGRQRQVRRIASVGTGAFLLAAAGILDGRRATTHWHAAPLFKQLFPAVELSADAIFVNDGNVHTSAGELTSIDFSLALVEEDMGPEAALAVSRELVLYLRRPGGQAQFNASLAAQARSDGLFAGLIAWIAENPSVAMSVPALAERAGMSERSFSRRFRAKTGLTPARYVEYVRLDRAKLYLETTRWPLARIAERAGFGATTSLARAFARHLQITPETYRQRFRLQPATESFMGCTAGPFRRPALVPSRTVMPPSL